MNQSIKISIFKNNMETYAIFNELNKSPKGNTEEDELEAELLE